MAQMRDLDPAAAAAFEADPVRGHWTDGDDPAVRVDEAACTLFALAREHSGGRVLVVMHSTLIRVLLCHLLGMRLADYRRRLRAPEPAALSTLRLSGVGEAALVGYGTVIPGNEPSAAGR